MVQKVLTSLQDKAEDDIVRYNFYISVIKILNIMGVDSGNSRKTETGPSIPNSNGVTYNPQQILQSRHNIPM